MAKEILQTCYFGSRISDKVAAEKWHTKQELALTEKSEIAANIYYVYVYTHVILCDSSSPLIICAIVSSKQSMYG